jgi:hypothetical protein
VIAWVAAAVYGIGLLFTWRHIAGRIAWEFGKPDADDIVAGLFFGGFCSIFWPISLPIALLSERGFEPGTRAAHLLGLLMRKPLKVRLREAADRERDMKYRIEQLERQVGIQ